MSTLTIVVLVIVGIILLPLLLRVSKFLFKLAIFSLLILIGIYLVKPEVIKNIFGSENVEKAEKVGLVVKDVTKSAFDDVKTGIDTINVENKEDSIVN